MRSIHIYCDGGFGNRLNGLIAGLLLAKAAGLHPIVCWPCNNWCGAKFSDLFENKEFEVIERELVDYVPIKEQFHFLMTEDHLGMGVPNRSPLQIPSLSEATAYIAESGKDVYFHCPLIPGFLELERVCEQLNALELNQECVARAGRFIKNSNLTDPFFGLQIRKTDFGSNAAKEDELLGLVKTCADKKFFVCSDSKEVESQFSKLPNVVVYEKEAYVKKLVEGDWNTLAADHSGRVYPCNVDRNAQSVKDALVDLVILSHSQIVKTTNSTFLNAALLLKTAREYARANAPSATPTPATAQKPTGPSTSAPFIKNGRRTIQTFSRWHLGDNLIHLHFLRKLSERYPDIEFQHALNPQYLGQCGEVISDMPAIRLVGLEEANFSNPIDAWKGAGNFFFKHPRRFEFGELYVDFFQSLADQMGLESPIDSKDKLLFDYPALKKRALKKDYDFLVVNSAPLSEQFKDYSEEAFLRILRGISAAGFSLITTKKVDGFECTLDSNLSVTGIGNVSLYAHFLVAVCTGSMWPCMNVFNNYRLERKIILNDHETIDFGENIQMARSMEEAIEDVNAVCSYYQPLRRADSNVCIDVESAPPKRSTPRARPSKPDVTLVMADTESYALAKVALNHSISQFNFKDVLIFSDAPEHFPGTRCIKINKIHSTEDYNHLILREIPEYLETDFFLVSQFDGFVINGGQFLPEFRDHDYIGAPWSMTDEFGVGNGGFSWRSRKLADAVKRLLLTSPIEEAEDQYICLKHRRKLESQFGCKFADAELAAKFAYENVPPKVRRSDFTEPSTCRVYSGRIWIFC